MLQRNLSPVVRGDRGADFDELSAKEDECEPVSSSLLHRETHNLQLSPLASVARTAPRFTSPGSTSPRFTRHLSAIHPNITRHKMARLIYWSRRLHRIPNNLDSSSGKTNIVESPSTRDCGSYK